MQTDPRVQAEIDRYGSLDLAIHALRFDADGSRNMNAPIHDILRAAIAERAARKQMENAQ